MLKQTITILLIIIISLSQGFTQEKVIDQVVAVVGNDVILLSDIENQVLQMQAEGINVEGGINCNVLENFLVQKLFLHQARVDSVQIDPSMVEEELNMRMNYFIRQIGSQKKLEDYYNKSIIEIKEDLRQMVYDQKLTQKMQQEIIGELEATPAEVKSFYQNAPRDSLPFIESYVEIQQVVKRPPYSEESIYDVRQRLLELRKRITEGEDFTTLAILYSEDQGTAGKGGELGMMSRAELVPEFAEAAFKLREGGVSGIVETEFGYHIIQLIEREGERVNVRHILMKPKISREAKLRVEKSLDSIARLIRQDSITFELAARRFSDDKKTRLNGGLMINPQTADSRIKLEELNRPDYFAARNLKVGEISEPYETFDEKGQTIFKIIRIKKRSEPHRANLKEDYTRLAELAKSAKRQDILNQWIKEKQKEVYIHLEENFRDCEFQNSGWLKE